MPIKLSKSQPVPVPVPKARSSASVLPQDTYNRKGWGKIGVNMPLSYSQVARMAPNINPVALQRLLGTGATVGLGTIDRIHPGVTRFGPPRSPNAPNYGIPRPTTPGEVTVDPRGQTASSLEGILSHELQHVRDRGITGSTPLRALEQRAHLVGGGYPEFGPGDYRYISRMPLEIRAAFQNFLRMYAPNQRGLKTGPPQMTR